MLEGLESREIEILDRLVESLFGAGRQIQLTPLIFSHALDIQRKHSLKGMDHLVYASVLSDLQLMQGDEAEVFVSRDKKDFLIDPGIEQELHGYNCKFFASFTDALGYVQRAIES